MSEEHNEVSENTASGVGKDDINMAILIHVLLLVTQFVGPLIIWLIKKDDSKYVDEQGKEALNFYFTMVLAFIACYILVFVAIGLVLLPLLGLYAFILVIIAIVKVSNGEHYRYPLTLRLLK